MEKFQKYFISLILSYKVRENTSLLRCTTNQVGTEHKLHFQPKIQLGSNWHESTTKMAVGRLKCDGDSFGSISYHWYYHVRSVKKIAMFRCSPNQAGTGHKLHFSPKIQLGPNWQQSTAKMAVARLRCDGDSFGSISYHLYYHVRPGKRLLCSVVTPT